MLDTLDGILFLKKGSLSLFNLRQPAFPSKARFEITEGTIGKE
jgi:hypothetical protein